MGYKKVLKCFIFFIILNVLVMPRKCCVPQCDSDWNGPSHKIPSTFMKDTWLDAIRRPDLKSKNTFLIKYLFEIISFFYNKKK